MMLALALAATPLGVESQYDLSCASSAFYLSLGDPDAAHQSVFHEVKAFYEGRLTVREPDMDVSGAENGEILLHGRGPREWQATLAACVTRYVEATKPRH